MNLTLLIATAFLACLCSVVSELRVTDNACSQREKCLHQDSCPSFLEAVARMKHMTGNDRENAVSNLRKKVCNKRSKGACCPDQDCKSVTISRCDSLAEDYRDVRGSNRRKKAAALTKIKALVCNKKTKLVWCGDTCPVGEPCDEIFNSSSQDSPKDSPKDSLQERKLPGYLPKAGQCGKASSSTQRVVGGQETKPGEFPFLALLGYASKKQSWDVPKPGCNILDDTVWGCGGTLINHWFVVTAAHCHSRRTKRRQIAKVRLGEWRVDKPDCIGARNEFCLPPVQEFDITPDLVSIHPSYEKTLSGVVNDIALVRLPRPAVVDGVGVQVVCLPLESATAAAELGLSDLREGLVGSRPRVVGWGHTEGLAIDRNTDTRACKACSKVCDYKPRVPSASQQVVDLPVLDHQECVEKLNNRFRNVKIDDSHMCAGAERKKDSCKGDSGGPLFLAKDLSSSLDDPGTHPWYLIGLVSFGSDTCGDGTPGVYTRLESFVPWIRATIGK